MDGPDYEMTSIRNATGKYPAIRGLDMGDSPTFGARVQADGGAVLWRPFHEAGGTWFWWSKEGGSRYVRLWRYLADYLLFNTWHSTFVSDTGINPVATFQAVHASPYVVTRDEVPNLR